jgi:hypothetical protein
MKPTELISVKILGNTYDIDVYGLTNTGHITDHDDSYGFGESAQVITNIDFDLVIIHLYGGTIDIDTNHDNWESVKKQVAEHILNDHEFMQAWQDRELGE